MRNKKKASDLLQEVTSDQGRDNLTLFELKDALHERGFGILMLIFSLPLSIPIPVPPGLTTIMSIPLLLLSWQIMLGYDSPWLPNWLGNRSVSRKVLATVVEKTAPLLQRLERLMRPRLSFFQSYMGEKVTAFICFLCAISIAIPLPLTNFIPAAGIALISLGIVSFDGLMVALGIFVGLIGLAVAIAVVIVGPKLIVGMWNVGMLWLKGLWN